MSASIPNLHMHDTCQCFPLYYYEPIDPTQPTLLDPTDGGKASDGYRRRDAITDAIHKTFREAYGPDVSKEDVFYYVYGVLHSPEYRRRFAADLKKMLPRIPLTTRAEDFRAFAQAGRDLARWHLNYETVEPYPVSEHTDTLAFDTEELFTVTKMTFGRKTKEIDKTTIIYNSHVTIKNIPRAAYDYVVNGKSAIEWIMERYQITRDKDSGIANDPNDWAKEHNEPRYIIDLLKRVIRVSLETNRIVAALPALNERK
jgi:predicted helicase